MWWANPDLNEDGETDEDDGEPRKGFYVIPNVDGRATLYLNDDAEDGGVFQPSGKIVRGEHEVAHFDGRFVVIAKHDPEDPRASEYSADLSVAAPNVLVFRSRVPAAAQEPSYTLRRSAACTLEQTALGVGSLVYAMMESRAEAIALGSQWLSR